MGGEPAPTLGALQAMATGTNQEVLSGLSGIIVPDVPEIALPEVPLPGIKSTNKGSTTVRCYQAW